MALLGIDEWRKDFLIGAGAGLFLIFLKILGIFSLALPVDPQSFATINLSLLVIVLFAPIIEEIFFRGIVKSFLLNITGNKLWASLGQAVSFALFHVAVYTGVALEIFQVSIFVAALGAFISAIFFGLFADYLAVKTNNLLTPIVSHGVINFWLVLGVLVVI